MFLLSKFHLLFSLTLFVDTVKPRSLSLSQRAVVLSKTYISSLTMRLYQFQGLFQHRLFFILVVKKNVFWPFTTLGINTLSYSQFFMRIRGFLYPPLSKHSSLSQKFHSLDLCFILNKQKSIVHSHWVLFLTHFNIIPL